MLKSISSQWLIEEQFTIQNWKTHATKDSSDAACFNLEEDKQISKTCRMVNKYVSDY
jgi:hypothetical protein